jgi:hypothetical protein
MATQQITSLFGAPVKQYPGQIQVTRRVKVQAPGKHFTGLTQSEQTKSYWATAVEYRERYQFERHTKGWGAAHTGPGIRFICDSDAIDDPDDKGFWTTVGLWNRWRHETYQDDREAEKEYLDELPAVPAGTADPAAQQKVAPPAAIKQHFRLVGEGLHTVGGKGSLAGRQLKFGLWACWKEGCARGAQKPIKQIGTATGDLFSHLDHCQPALALQLRAASAHSPVRIGEDGIEYSLYSFDELLPHHVRYVQKCFRSFDHFYETRAGNGLLEYVQGFDKRAALPHADTCKQILEARAAPLAYPWHATITRPKTRARRISLRLHAHPQHSLTLSHTR